MAATSLLGRRFLAGIAATVRRGIIGKKQNKVCVHSQSASCMSNVSVYVKKMHQKKKGEEQISHGSSKEPLKKKKSDVKFLQYICNIFLVFDVFNSKKKKMSPVSAGEELTGRRSLNLHCWECRTRKNFHPTI